MVLDQLAQLLWRMLSTTHALTHLTLCGCGVGNINKDDKFKLDDIQTRYVRSVMQMQSGVDEQAAAEVQRLEAMIHALDTQEKHLTSMKG